MAFALISCIQSYCSSVCTQLSIHNGPSRLYVLLQPHRSLYAQLCRRNLTWIFPLNLWCICIKVGVNNMIVMLKSKYYKHFMRPKTFWHCQKHVGDALTLDFMLIRMLNVNLNVCWMHFTCDVAMSSNLKFHLITFALDDVLSLILKMKFAHMQPVLFTSSRSHCGCHCSCIVVCRSNGFL